MQISSLLKKNLLKDPTLLLNPYQPLRRLKSLLKKNFAKVALDKYIENFIVYVIFLLTIVIRPAKKVQIALLVVKKVQILIKYLDF